MLVNNVCTYDGWGRHMRYKTSAHIVIRTYFTVQKEVLPLPPTGTKDPAVAAAVACSLALCMLVRSGSYLSRFARDWTNLNRNRLSNRGQCSSAITHGPQGTCHISRPRALLVETSKHKPASKQASNRGPLYGHLVSCHLRLRTCKQLDFVN